MVEDIVTSRHLRDALPVFTALASVLLGLAIAATLYFGREIFIPIALAILLSFALAPAVQLLQRARVPRGLAAPGVVIIAFVGLVALGIVIVGQVTQLAAELPQYRSSMQGKIKSLRGAMENSGVLGRALDVIQDLGQEFEEPVPGSGDAPASSNSARTIRPSDRPVPVEVHEPDAGPFEAIGNVISPVLHPLATAGLILIFAMFILIQREDLRNRFIRLAGASDLQKTTAAIDDAARRLSRLLLTQLAVNTCFGVVIGVGLWLIGIPSPALWGILGAVLRFVPYVGAIISAALPVFLAAAVDPGWSMVLWTAALFLLVEPVLGHVVEPMLYGHSTGLSPVAVIVSATLWTFLWGPIGLVLATPLTVCLVVLGRHADRLKFLDVMLGDRPALSPPQIFYQRMLAGDPVEAVEQAKDFLKQRALSTYYDEVALEGIRLAQADIANGALAGERQETMRQSLRDLVIALSAVDSASPARRGVVGTEAAAAVEVVGPDRPVASIARRAGNGDADWLGETAILCVAGQGVLDEAVALMLGQLFDKHGLATEVMGPEVIASDDPLPANFSGAALVCCSYLDALSTVHIRYAARRLRRKAPEARIMVGLWRQRDPTTLEGLRRATSADVLVTSLHDALDGAIELSGKPRAKAVLRASATA